MADIIPPGVTFVQSDIRRPPPIEFVGKEGGGNSGTANHGSHTLKLRDLQQVGEISAPS